jgi:hypothetical protein
MAQSINGVLEVQTDPPASTTRIVLDPDSAGITAAEVASRGV